MENTQSQATLTVDVEKIRQDFPILHQTLYDNKPLVYLDSAATSQKPMAVINALEEYYLNDNANVHRGIHALAHRATLAYEGSREKVRKFINAASNKEVIFTMGTTDSINLVAYSWGQANLGMGDAILLSEMEHHSNIIPWQILSANKGFKIRYIKVNENGDLDMDHFDQILDKKVKLVAVTQMSNVFGTINPISEIIKKSHSNGSLVLLDGAQGAAHFSIDVQKCDVDFYAFSGHKMMGPTGIGALYAKEEILESMPPFKGGGEMIRDVEYFSFTTASLPQKFEAGTPNIGGAIGFGAAIDYLTSLGMENIHQYETELGDYARKQLATIKNINIYGDPSNRGGVIPFNVGNIHASDLSQFLDQHGVAIRSGHHCAQPLMKKLGVSVTARASLYVYNTFEEVDILIQAIEDTQRFF